MKFCFNSGKYGLRIFAVLVFLCLLPACRKKQPPEVPSVRADGLLEILRLLDMKAYKAALPKIENYQTLDETNAFLGEMRTAVITNVVIQDVQQKIRQKDFEGGQKILDDAISRYGNLPGLIKTKRDFEKVVVLEKQIRILKGPCTSRELLKIGEQLRRASQEVKSAKMLRFAMRKIEDSKVMKDLEYDRAGFLIYADALDAMEQKDLSTAMALTILLDSEKKFPEAVSRLSNSGLYDYAGEIPPLPEWKKRETQVSDNKP